MRHRDCTCNVAAASTKAGFQVHDICQLCRNTVHASLCDGDNPVPRGWVEDTQMEVHFIPPPGVFEPETMTVKPIRAIRITHSALKRTIYLLQQRGFIDAATLEDLEDEALKWAEQRAQGLKDG